MLDIAAHQPRLILELPAGALECIVDGEGQVGIAFILPRRTSNVNLPIVRQCQPNTHLVLTTGLVMITWTFDHDAGRGDPTKAALQLGDMPINGAANLD
jgi:hypothetical protein